MQMKTAKNYLQLPYARIVIPVEPSGYHAEIFEFPGCYAQGETVGQAYANLENAAESWIEACLSQGQGIPEPSSSLTFSGRIALRLPRTVHRHAAQMAERDRTSLNTYLVSAVSARVGAEEFYNVLAQRLEQRLTMTVSNLAYAAFHAWQDYLAEQTSAKSEIGSEIRPLPIESTAGTTGVRQTLASVGR
jgi:predicted RNase H-like HicB family nuclease